MAAYQTIAPLTLGELWAIPIMLRLALIENLRRIAVRIAADKRDRNKANHWADRLIKVAEEDPRNLILVLADMARSEPPTSSAFIAELARRLQGQGPALAFPLSWIEQRLAEDAQTIERLVHAEGQRQAADQVSIGNSIGSLRMLGATDWREFVEAMSVVDKILHDDPTGTFAAMDFATRDLYRHAVEEIAKRSPLSQPEVAERAVALARESSDRQQTAIVRAQHVGFYLIGKGRSQLERAAKFRRSLGAGSRAAGAAFPFGLYAGAILAITAAIVAVSIQLGARHVSSLSAIAIFAIPLAFGTSQLAVALVNWLVTIAHRPQAAAEARFFQRHSTGMRTRWSWCRRCSSSAKRVADLLEGLEVRYLANRDDNLHFALVTDFLDAPQETMPGDETLAAPGKGGNRGLESSLQGATAATVSFSSTAPGASTRTSVCGWDTNASAASSERSNALLRGRPEEHFALIVGRDSRLARRALRDHPRYRHPAPARRRAAARGNDRSPPQSRAYSIRRPTASPRATASSSRAWPRACQWRPVALSAALRRRVGRRPLQPHRL